MKKKRKRVKLELIDWFSARGMERLYAEDHHMFEGKRKYSMEIWLTKDGRLLMRFFNRCEDAENINYEIKGMNPSDIPRDAITPRTWIPGCIAEAFYNWMISEMPFFISMNDLYNFVKKEKADRRTEADNRMNGWIKVL